MYHNWLCSPVRMKWIGGKKPSGCVFCKIAKGDSKVPGKILYRDKRFMVLMNIFPYNTGHIMVMPVKHARLLEDLDDDDTAGLFVLVKKCVNLLKKAINPAGFNIGLNEGGSAGASIPHIHVHIVPRFSGDLGFIDVIGATKVMPEPVDVTFKKLKKHVKMLE